MLKPCLNIRKTKEIKNEVVPIFMSFTNLFNLDNFVTTVFFLITQSYFDFLSSKITSNLIKKINIRKETFLKKYFLFSKFKAFLVCFLVLRNLENKHPFVLINNFRDDMI